MIIKRKLFSKKLTAEEKKQRAADQIDKNRKGVATAHGILAGGTVAGVGLLGSDIARNEAMYKVTKQTNKHVDKISENYSNKLDKIRNTGDKVRELAKKRLKKTGNPIKDLANELDIDRKVDYVENVYKTGAGEEYNAKIETLKKASNRLKDRISKKASKRNKKILAGAALLGTAAGLASNHSMKKRAEKLRENKFSKADDLDEETYLGISEEFDDSKFSRKSDKWLKERARYDEGLTDKEKENIKKNNKRLIAATSVSGASIGLAKKLSLKRGLIGAGIGAATGAGIAAAGHLHHKSEARKARKELERREKED